MGCDSPSVSQFPYELVRVHIQFMFFAEVNPEFGAHYKAKPSVRSVFTFHHQRNDVFMQLECVLCF